MINGVNLSEIAEVNRAHLNHYQRLDSIVNSESAHLAALNKQFSRVITTHKSIHENWKKYKQQKYHSEIQRGNECYRKKLESIKMGRSRYNFKERESLSASKAHNFYIRKKKEISIDIENPEIARRIINAQGNLSLSRAKLDFERSKELVHRLEKFPILKRMNELSEKRLLCDRHPSPDNAQSHPHSHSHTHSQCLEGKSRPKKQYLTLKH